MAGKFKLIHLLAVGAALGVLLGCGSAPSSQTAEVVTDPMIAKAEQPTAESAQPESVARPVLAESGLRPAAAGASEPDPLAVEIGYKIGMQVPEFGMSLNDGKRVASSDLVNWDKPTLLYFHATW